MSFAPPMRPSIRPVATERRTLSRDSTMGATYDTGALLAAERNDRRIWALHARCLARKADIYLLKRKSINVWQM